MVIYQATNTVNGKIYIGATVQEFKQRRSSHRYRASSVGQRSLVPFHKAIRKYGFDAFEWDILEECDSLGSLLRAECKWISDKDSMDRYVGYNRTEGGGGSTGWIPSEETRKKMSAALIGRAHSKESRAKRSASLKGRKPSAAAIKSLKNRVWTPEQREKQRQRMLGRKNVWSRVALENVRVAAKRKSELGNGAKLKPYMADEIWAWREVGFSLKRIGAAYNVTAGAVCYFCQRYSKE